MICPAWRTMHDGRWRGYGPTRTSGIGTVFRLATDC